MKQLWNSEKDTETFSELSRISNDIAKAVEGIENGDKFVTIFNEMLLFFKNTLDKNTTLVNECSKMNSKLVDNANTIRNIIVQTSTDKDEVSKLLEELNTATLQSKEAQQKSQDAALLITKYREQIESDLQKTKAIKKDNVNVNDVKKEIAKLQKEIENNKEYADSLSEEIEEAKRFIEVSENAVENGAKSIETIEKEIGETEKFAEQRKQENYDMHPQIAEIKEANKEASDLCKKLEKQVAETKPNDDLKVQLLCVKNDLTAISRLKNSFNETFRGKKVHLEQIKTENNKLITEAKMLKQQIENAGREVQVQKDALAETVKEGEGYRPDIAELEKKHKEMVEQKNQIRKDCSDMLREIVSLSFTRVTKENEKNLDSRKATSNESLLKVIEKDVEEEKVDNKDIERQNVALANKTILERNSQQEMAISASKILDEIAEKQIETSFFCTKAEGLVKEKEIMERDRLEAGNALNGIKANINIQKERINSMYAERANLVLKQKAIDNDIANVRKNLEEVRNSIGTMSLRIDNLVAMSKKEHDAAIALKEANVNIEAMKNSCFKGMKTAEKVNLSILNERVALHQLLQHLQYESQQQKKDFTMLSNSYYVTLTQLKRKEQKIEAMISETLTLENVLENSKKRYKKKIDEIEESMKLYNYFRNVNTRLSNLFDHKSELLKDKKKLSKSILNEQLKAAQLSIELEKPRTIHNITVMEAIKPELAKQVRYLMNLKNRLVETQVILDNAKDMRDDLKKSYEALKTEFESDDTTVNDVRRMMYCYEEDIKTKDGQIQHIRDSIENGTAELEDTCASVDKAKEDLNKRKEDTAMYKSKIFSLRSSTNDCFITNLPISTMSVSSGGFAPHMPQTQRTTKRYYQTKSVPNGMIPMTTRRQKGKLYKPLLPGKKGLAQSKPVKRFTRPMYV